MKVVEVHYKGNRRNVFLYEGMSAAEVAKLLCACVSASAPLGSSGRALPQIVALRDPASGTVIPLSLALKHIPSLWDTVELIDERQVQQGATGPAININATNNSNYAQGARPASASQAALPTPIARNAAAGAPRPSTAGYAAQQQSRPVQRVNNYTSSASSRQAPMHNFVNSSSPDDSAASSPRFESRGDGAASPTFSLASSQGSWNDPASGIHVIMSYNELLNVLTGNQAPNTNNGSTPRAIRAGREVLYCLGAVRPGSDKCEAIFPPFEAMALSNNYPNLVFLIIEAELLQGTNLQVDESALPTFQFFLQGHLLGQLVTPTLPQLDKILQASNNLVEENPDMSVEASEVDEEEDGDEEQEEAYRAQRTAEQQQSYALGEALDQRSQLTAEERRQLFQDISEEEQRWAQLLQASPKANRRRGGASASPSPSASEAEDSDGEGIAAPGLVIRGTKITLQPQPQAVAQRRSANPEQNLRDWDEYQRFDDPAESSGVDESNYEGSSDDGRDDDGAAEYEQAAQAYNRARQAIAAHNAQQQSQQQSHKRKVHPPIASSSDEDEASVADGGSDDQGMSPYSSLGNSLTASPVIVGRDGPSSPNGRAITAPAAGSNNAGLVMSPTEAANIERLLLRADPAVQAAFRAFPELDSVMDVFIRLVHLQIANPAEMGAGAGGAAAPAVHVGTKRKVHPDPRPLADEPPRKQKHLELTPAQQRAAQIKEQQAAAALALARRHKRPNQQVYASASASEVDEPADSEDEAAAGGHARTRSELAAQSHLASQQDRYAALQAQYAAIQNEIFSKTVHDLHEQTIISDQQLQSLVYLWTETEQGSDAIRMLIKQYEADGDELNFMERLVALVHRFQKGLPVGADDMASPSDSEGMPSPRASASEDSEGQDDDDEEEVDVGSDGGSPLPSDEEQQYRALMRAFASEQGAPGSSVSGSEAPSTQASPARVPRSSTKAPQSSPAVAAGSASEQQEQQLSFNLALITRLCDSQLLSSSESLVAQQYVLHGHPLMQAAFMAFAYNEDLEDLIETIRDVVGAEARRQEAGAAGAKGTAAAAPNTAAAAAPSTPLTAEDLLAVLPPWLVSAHGSLIEQLVRRNDAAIVAAWNALMVAVQSKRGPELATEVERMIEAVEQRLVQLAEGVEAQQKQQAQAQASAASSSSPDDSPLSDASIADALQIASVLHVGRVFDDEETAVLWALILQGNPTIIAAFDLAREDEEWEELHGTLIRVLEKNSSLKSSLHPLLPLVREATGVMSQAQVTAMKQMMAAAKPAAVAAAKPAAAAAAPSSASKSAAPQQAASSSVTPLRALAQSVLPKATPLSPSIPTTAWSKILSQFSRSLESLQSAGHLTDSAALQLIDLFQARNDSVFSACQVLELDGNVDEFEDTLRVIIAEHQEMALRSPNTQKKMQAQAAQDKPKQSANDKMGQSFAERVQAVDAADSSEFDDEEEEEDEEDEQDEDGDDSDAGSDDSALNRLLAKSEHSEWGEEDVNALYAKVLEMQSQLTALRQRQIDESGAAGSGAQTQRGARVDESDDGSDDDDDEDWEDEEDEDEEDEDQEEEQ